MRRFKDWSGCKAPMPTALKRRTQEKHLHLRGLKSSLVLYRPGDHPLPAGGPTAIAVGFGVGVTLERLSGRGSRLT